MYDDCYNCRFKDIPNAIVARADNNYIFCTLARGHISPTRPAGIKNYKCESHRGIVEER